MPKNIQTETERLYDVLILELMQFRPGQKFFSSRTILERFGCSRRALDRVLERLKKEQKIICDGRKGIFVASPESSVKKRILYIHTDWPSEYCRDLEKHIEEAVVRHGYDFLRYYFSPENGAAEYMKCFEERSNDAIIVTMAVGWRNIDDLARIINTGIPLIFLTDHFYGAGGNLIDTLPEYSGMLAADHLLKNGHRKIALLLSEPWSPAGQRINNGFLCRLELAGVKAIQIDCKMKNGISSPGRAFDVIDDYLEKRGNLPEFTALYAMSDESAIGAMKAFQQAGLQVPEDVSIMGCFGSPVAAVSEPPLTTVARDHAAIGRAIAEGLDDLFAGKKFGIRVVPPHLMPRSSVCNLQKKRKRSI